MSDESTPTPIRPELKEYKVATETPEGRTTVTASNIYEAALKAQEVVDNEELPRPTGEQLAWRAAGRDLKDNNKE